MALFWFGRADPHDCCPTQRERVSISPQSHALPGQTCMSSKHYSQYPDFFLYQGVWSAFFLLLLILSALKLDRETCPQPPFKLRAGHRYCCCHFKGETIVRNHAWYFHKQNVKLPILRLGFYLDVKVNCKFAIIFHTPQNLRHLEMASGFITGTHTGTKHSKNKDWKRKKNWLQWLVSVRLFQIMLIDLLFRAVVMKCSPFLIVEIEFMYIFIFF